METIKMTRNQYLKIAAVVIVTIAIVNTLVKRVPVAGPILGQVMAGL